MSFLLLKFHQRTFKNQYKHSNSRSTSGVTYVYINQYHEYNWCKSQHFKLKVIPQVRFMALSILYFNAPFSLKLVPLSSFLAHQLGSFIHSFMQMAADQQAPWGEVIFWHWASEVLLLWHWGVPRTSPIYIRPPCDHPQQTVNGLQMDGLQRLASFQLLFLLQLKLLHILLQRRIRVSVRMPWRFVSVLLAARHSVVPAGKMNEPQLRSRRPCPSFSSNKMIIHPTTIQPHCTFAFEAFK